MDNEIKYGGGSWLCHKCKKTIQGSSLYHECNMEPKNKAGLLVNRFRDYTDGTDSESERYSPRIEKQNAIQCALLLVNEIFDHMYSTSYTKEDTNNPTIQYWRTVEKELISMKTEL